MPVAVPLPRPLLVALLTVSLAAGAPAQSVVPSLTLRTKHLGGVVTPKDSATRAVSHALGRRVFDCGMRFRTVPLS